MKHFFLATVLCAVLLLSTATAYAAQVPVAAWIYEGNEKVALAGASFSLSTNPHEIGQTILTTDETGHLVFTDLSEGTYYLHQTAAPGLYRPLAHPLQLQLSEDGSLSVEGNTTDEVSLLHRSSTSLLLIAAVIVSLIPMVVRLVWLHHRENKR